MRLNAKLTKTQTIAGLLVGGFVIAVLALNDTPNKPQTPDWTPSSPSTPPPPPTRKMSELEKALYEAIVEGNVAAIRSALQNGADINARLGPFAGGTPLMIAASMGREETVRYLIGAGADIDSRDEAKKTALHWAAASGKIEVAKILIRSKASVNVRDNDGITPLVFLARDAEATQLLLEAGAEVNVDNSLAAPLSMAAYSGNVQVVKVLLQAGANVHARDGFTGYTALMNAAEGGGNVEVMRLLTQAGAEINARRESRGDTALMRAAFQRRTHAVTFLLQAGADMNARDNNGDTALTYALHLPAGDSRTLVETLRLLIQGGANVNAKNSKGETPLWSAYCTGCEQARAFLLSVGAME